VRAKLANWTDISEVALLKRLRNGSGFIEPAPPIKRHSGIIPRYVGGMSMHFKSPHITRDWTIRRRHWSALVWLEKAFEARSGMLIGIRMYPDFKNVLSRLAFQQLVLRVGLPS
jgi:hypothetical protein